MFSAYTGNSAYCFSNSLHMCLHHVGMPDLPEMGLLECMTGMPIGACFLKLEEPLFFPSPACLNPNSGLTGALEILGWSCNLWEGEDEGCARLALTEALSEGPVLIGPLDMGFLSYDPNHMHKRGADHFIVALMLDGDRVQVHDPQFYPFAVLPMTDLMRAWDARNLRSATTAYTLRFSFREQTSECRERMLNDTLSAALELLRSGSDGPIAYGGPTAFALTAGVLQNAPSRAFCEFLTQFALPLGARRSLDAAGFLMIVGKNKAARIMKERAEAFGQAQYLAVQKDWGRTTKVLQRLATLEARIAESL